jgi:hypothetical protein
MPLFPSYYFQNKSPVGIILNFLQLSIKITEGGCQYFSVPVFHSFFLRLMIVSNFISDYLLFQRILNVGSLYSVSVNIYENLSPRSQKFIKACNFVTFVAQINFYLKSALRYNHKIFPVENYILREST